MVLTSAWWRFLQDTVYATDEPPPRKRTVPLEVICVGPPRSATESLQAGLLQLGYKHTYHGWDILFEQPNRAAAWARMCRRKWLNDPPNQPLTRDDFDALLGESMAVTDVPASCFAAELIEAYPEAKVVINKRNDLDAWLRSMDESVLAVPRSKFLWLAQWFDPHCFHIYNAIERLLVPGLMRCVESREGVVDATLARGKWVYKEHCAMVRGLVPPERLLEWSVQDGWEPLCKFLDKPVPEGPFPHVNTRSEGWKKREEEWNKTIVSKSIRNMAITLAVLVAGGGVLAYRQFWS